MTILKKRMNQSHNYLITMFLQGICRTDPATQGLLKIDFMKTDIGLKRTYLLVVFKRLAPSFL